MRLARNSGKEIPSLAAGQEGESMEGGPCCHPRGERGKGRERKGGGRKEEGEAASGGEAVNGAGEKKTELRGEATT